MARQSPEDTGTGDSIDQGSQLTAAQLAALAEQEESAQTAAEAALSAVLLALLMGSGANSDSFGMGLGMKLLILRALTKPILTSHAAPILKPAVIESMARSAGISGVPDMKGELGVIADAAVDHTISELAKRLPDIVDNLGSGGTQALADTTARIMTQTALNKGKNDGAEALGFTTRVWRTRMDNKVRTSHIFAEGQRRGLDEPFDVGQTRMMYPGDRSAPIGEWMNCRCRLELSNRP